MNMPSAFLASRRRRVSLAIGVGVLVVLIALLAVVLLSPSQPLPTSNLTPEEQNCTTADVGPDFVVNRTYDLAPSPGDSWTRGVGIAFDDTSGRNVTLTCAVFQFGTVAERDSDYAKRQGQAVDQGWLTDTGAPTVGDASFYFSWSQGQDLFYGIYFLRGTLGILVNLLAPTDFPFHAYTSSLAQTLVMK